MGQDDGIGPEIIIKTLFSNTLQNIIQEFNFLLIGSDEVFSKTAQKIGIKFNPIKLFSVDLSSQKNGNIFLFEPNVKSLQSGSLALECILSAIFILKANRAVALVTAPVSKEAIQKTGVPFIGHTELLAQKTLSRKVTMMFVSPQLKVSLVTTHIPYRKISLYLTVDKVLATIEQTDGGLRKYFGITHPRLAVCSLNPHSGEGGKSAREEDKIITPAVKLAQRRKIRCEGPFPSDSIFHRAKQGEFDCVVALYHDQGIIPIKTLSFFEAVQVTLGLPFIRTSPAHGVAFDIAGKGIANPSSMIEAIKLAIFMIKQGTTLWD